MAANRVDCTGPLCQVKVVAGGKAGVQSGVPTGKVHLAIELGTLPGWVALGAVVGVGRSSLLLFAGGYVAGSMFLSPDLDLTRSDAARRWGVVRFLWRPYAALFRHRGLSHAPVVGPLTRLAYLGALASVGWAILRAVADVSPLSFSLATIAPTLVGLYLPQLLHILLDRSVTTGRRLLLRRR